MNKLTTRFQPSEWLLLASCLLLFLGFNVSRAMVSISMVGFVLAGIVATGSFSPVLWFKNSVKMLRTQNGLAAVTLFFWIVFAGGIFSDNKTEWLSWVRIKVPYLVMPTAFSLLPHIGKKLWGILLYLYCAVFSISVAVVLVNYALQYDHVTNSFLFGSGISMPFSHIRYSLMLVFAVFALLYLLETEFILKWKVEVHVQRTLLVFLFVAIHIISVRSGLVALYLTLLAYILRWMITRKKWLTGLLALVLIVSLPALAYRFIPSLHNKIEFMLYDLERFGKGEVNTLNDAMRIVSVKVGMDIANNNILTGTGIGDLRSATEQYYQRYYPDITPENYRLPHNQWVWVFASSGLLSLLIFCHALYAPMLHSGALKHWLPWAFTIIMLSSMLTEHTLEEQMGTAFYVTFLLLLMNHFGRAHE